MKTGNEALAFARVRIVLSKQLYLKKYQLFSLLSKCVLMQNIDLHFEICRGSVKRKWLNTFTSFTADQCLLVFYFLVYPALSFKLTLGVRYE